VETPAAVAAVRGTEFYVEPRGKDSTYLCVCRGKVEVRGSGGSRFKTTMKGKHHTAALIQRSGESTKKRPAAMEGHTDAEISALKTPSQSP
jgi:hypothetical protein